MRYLYSISEKEEKAHKNKTTTANNVVDHSAQSQANIDEISRSGEPEMINIHLINNFNLTIANNAI